MAIDARKRQKKLERRKAKEKAKRKTLAQRGSRDVAAHIERTAAASILHCCTSDALWEQGMSNVLVSRELASGSVAFVAFLIDMYCLGVKDVAFDVVPRSRYDGQVYGKLFHDALVVNLDPEAARKLVEDAVEYARDLGLSPHADYRKAKFIFGDINADSCTEEFVFGKAGKPCFIAGPNDSPSRCNQIIRILTDRCGTNGFDHLLPLAGTGARVLAVGEHDETD